MSISCLSLIRNDGYWLKCSFRKAQCDCSKDLPTTLALRVLNKKKIVFIIFFEVHVPLQLKKFSQRKLTLEK